MSNTGPDYIFFSFIYSNNRAERYGAGGQIRPRRARPFRDINNDSDEDDGDVGRGGRRGGRYDDIIRPMLRIGDDDRAVGRNQLQLREGRDGLRQGGRGGIRGGGGERGGGGQRGRRGDRGAEGGGRLPRGRKLDIHYLTELKGREEADIAMTLAHPDSGFRNCLKDAAHKSGLVRLLLNILAKAFRCNSAPQNLNILFLIIKETNFFDTTINFFLDMLSQDIWENEEQFRDPIADMITIMEELMEKNPHCITEFVGK